MIRIYNTLSERKEPLPDRRPLRLFVCGPTVYNQIHIGNARTFLNFDLFVRFLRSRKIKIAYLQNITDVDDKIITRAIEEGVSWRAIAGKYEKAYRKDLRSLGINTTDKFARATDYIKEIQKQVKTLINKGHVYKIEGDGWYFDLKTFPGYGKLARRTVEQAEDGVSRIDSSDNKRNRGDFCVWKFSKGENGEPSWKFNHGAGRPGWHIEDTAITESVFGPQYEIHGGALDLKFPHHEAEIAQQESASGKNPMVQIWMHAGFLKVGGEKMSKSLGNFMFVEDLLKKHDSDTFRMAAISHHYRSPMDWDETLARIAVKNLKDIRIFIAKLEMVEKRGNGKEGLNLDDFKKKFDSSLDDDFNTPEALGVLMSFMGEANKKLWDLAPHEAKKASAFVREVLENWGFKKIEEKIPLKARRLALKREKLRRNKQFIPADALRVELEQLGYRSEDTPLGPFVWLNR